jgi:hypothetical protein
MSASASILSCAAPNCTCGGGQRRATRGRRRRRKKKRRTTRGRLLAARSVFNGPETAFRISWPGPLPACRRRRRWTPALAWRVRGGVRVGLGSERTVSSDTGVPVAAVAASAAADAVHLLGGLGFRRCGVQRGPAHDRTKMNSSRSLEAARRCCLQTSSETADMQV